MLDLQTHVLPENRDELRKLALRMGYTSGKGTVPIAARRASGPGRDVPSAGDEQSALEAF